jgi:hypothetical protein
MAVEALRAQITDALQSTDIELAERLMDEALELDDADELDDLLVELEMHVRLHTPHNPHMHTLPCLPANPAGLATPRGAGVATFPVQRSRSTLRPPRCSVRTD